VKKVLYIIPYTKLFPPINGGMLRNYFLCNELSKYTELSLLVLQPKEEFINGKEGFKWNEKIKIICPPIKRRKNNIFNRIFNAFKGRYYRRSLFTSASTFILQAYPVAKRLLKDNWFDIIVFAHLESLSLCPLVHRLNPRALTVFDAHNIDHKLFTQNNDMRSSASKRMFQNLKDAECSLYKLVDIFLACSETDKTELSALNGNRIKGFVVPNGANTYNNKFKSSKDTSAKTLIFCGSLDYAPNKDGLIWFFNDVWPFIKHEVPDVKLTIIGRNGSSHEYDVLRQDQHIRFIGEVEDVIPHYCANNVAIVPLRAGSGTRLKILEAMSLGNPVVSTTIGAEGISYQSGMNILIADSENDFASAVIQALSSKDLCEQIRNGGRELIDTMYSWEAIGKGFFVVVKEAHDNHAKAIN
jgi:glycosyltransferase involved in cell wall biosynthesis